MGVAAALVTRARTREPCRTTSSSADQGPLRAGSVGPKTATSGAPMAPAIWRGPVSAPRKRRAVLREGREFEHRGLGRAFRGSAGSLEPPRPQAPLRRAPTGPPAPAAWSESPFATSPHDSGDRACSPSLRPGKIRARGLPIDWRGTPRPWPPRPRAERRESRATRGRRCPRPTSSAWCWSMTCTSSGSTGHGLGQHHARRSLAAVIRHPADPPRRAREPGPERRLPQALRVDRDVGIEVAERPGEPEPVVPVVGGGLGQDEGLAQPPDRAPPEAKPGAPPPTPLRGPASMSDATMGVV